jgi:glyoxylase-like metal-dependent hydrolase (beta-lactamase superfamily II)
VVWGDTGDAEIKTTHLAGSVYLIEGAGGNIGASVGPDGVLLVDAQYEALAGKIREALKSLGHGAVKYIVNTHYHGDHVSGNAAFGREAVILAHANVRKRVTTPQQIMDHPVDPLDEAGWPVITFENSLSIFFNGEEIQVIHITPGHTDGDAMVYFTESNVLHVGDHLFSGMFPFVDLGAGGTVDGYVENLKTVVEKFPADVKIIPGHGPLSAIKDVEAMIAMIEETAASVRGRMKEGKTLEEIKKAGLPDEWASFDWPFITTDIWIETIYQFYSE